jgi:hypothetical protein
MTLDWKELHFPRPVTDVRRESISMKPGVYGDILIVVFEGGSALVDKKGIRALYQEGGYRGEKEEG